MFPRSKWLNIVSWLAPVLTAVIAVGLDRWEEAVKREASATFNFAPAVWGGLGANLVVSALLLLLAWLVAFRAGRTRGPAALCLLLGVLAAGYPWLFIVTGQGIPQIFMWPLLRDLRALFMESGLSSRSLLASNFFVLAGLAGLIFPGRQAEPVQEHPEG